MAARNGALYFFNAAKGLNDNKAAGKHSAAKDMMEQFQMKPTRTVMIGDTTHDAEVAKHLGVDCILVSSGHHSRDRLIKKDCPVFDSLGALSAPLELAR
jgi:phosphoglycolate phosphatase